MGSPPLHKSLQRILKASLEGCRRLGILAVGSTLRGDDAAGMLFGRALQAALRTTRSIRVTKVFLGETVPENLTGDIRRFRPSHVLLVDAAEMGQSAGTISLIEPHRAGGNFPVSTHALSLGVLADYMERSIGCQVILLGIQPATRGYGAGPSRQVRQAARWLAAMIAAIRQTRPARAKAKAPRPSRRRKNAPPKAQS